MEAFFNLFATVLAFFYDLVPNYAVAIILLTLVVMIVVTPLTLKGTRSMMVMQQLQPEMRKIQTQYKDDRQRLNEELLKFYKENNINPLGGCLPLLVQMPVFLVLYQVLRGLTRRVSDLGFSSGWVGGFQFNGITPTKPPSFDRVFDPAYLNTGSTMYQDLSSTYQMEAFGMDLSESASSALGQGILHALPFLVLIAIVAVTGFVQQRQIQGRNPNAQVNPQQQMIMKLMPIFLPVISFGLPAGLVLYFAVSNLYRIGQQAFISRSIYGMKGGKSSGSASDEKQPGPSFKEMLGFGSRDGGSGGSKPKSKPKPKSGSLSSAKSKSKPSGSSKGQGGRSGAKSSGRTTPAKSSGRQSGRSQPTTKSGSEPKQSGGTSKQPSSGSTPTLQPRARKNPKKR